MVMWYSLLFFLLAFTECISSMPSMPSGSVASGDSKYESVSAESTNQSRCVSGLVGVPSQPRMTPEDVGA